MSESDAAAAPPRDDAVAVAADWIDAVVWGEHNKVWELISAEGRTEVLDIAKNRGMDEGLAARLAGDEASPAEKTEFLVDLVNGLRGELSGNDLDNLTYEIDEEYTGASRVGIKMFVPLHPLLGGTLPVGTVFLVPDGGQWRIQRLIPLTSK